MLWALWRHGLRRPATGTSTSNSAGLARTAWTVHRSDSNALCNSTAKLCFPSAWARNGSFSATVPWWLLLVSLASFFADPKLACFADFADFAERRASSRGSPCHQPRYDLENHSNHSHSTTIFNASPQLCYKKVTHSWPCAAPSCTPQVRSVVMSSRWLATGPTGAQSQAQPQWTQGTPWTQTRDDRDSSRDFSGHGKLPSTVAASNQVAFTFPCAKYIQPKLYLSHILVQKLNGVSHNLWGCEDPMMRKLTWSVSFDLLIQLHSLHFSSSQRWWTTSRQCLYDTLWMNMMLQFGFFLWIPIRFTLWGCIQAPVAY